jgi:LPS-assembly lipoprotein
MMKKFTHSLLALTLLSLTACGFTPIHQSQTGLAGQSYANVRIDALGGDNPDDKEAGFHIKQAMIDRIGQSANGQHTLEINPRLRQRRLGIRGDDVASRFQIELSANYKLIDDKTGDILDEGQVRSASSFGSPIDPFGRISAEENASLRIATDIADDLVIILSKYYANQES